MVRDDMDGDMDHTRQTHPMSYVLVWLAVSTPLKNINQLLFTLFPIYGKHLPTSYVLVHRCRRLASGQNVARKTEMDVDGIAMERRCGE